MLDPMIDTLSVQLGVWLKGRSRTSVSVIPRITDYLPLNGLNISNAWFHTAQKASWLQVTKSLVHVKMQGLRLMIFGNVYPKE